MQDELSWSYLASVVVIPAKAGIQGLQGRSGGPWISAFRGCQEILRTDNSSSPRKRGPRACPWHEQGGKRLKSLGSRFRGNDEQRAQRQGRWGTNKKQRSSRRRDNIERFPGESRGPSLGGRSGGSMG